MPARSIRALITCEVTTEFLASLKERSIEFELCGWGKNGKTLSDVELIAKARDCEIVIVEIEELNRKVLESLPNLKFVGVSRGTPVNVDLGFCEQQKIPVIHTPGRNADSVADYCLGMMLDLSRKLTLSSRHLSDEGWLFEGKLPYLEFRGREIGNLVVGLYGFGQIGVRVAQRLSNGFGAKVYYFDPFVESSSYATKVSSLEELFEVSDIVSLHAPVINSTENTVDRTLLKKLGPEGILISSARAKLVVEEDLYHALKTKEIASAAIDVFWNEPIEATDRWLALPNVICTPHIAGASLDVVSNHCETILSGIDKWLSSNNSVKGPA
jgi:D-3-phosphoglycerate dehydrogenase